MATTYQVEKRVVTIDGVLEKEEIVITEKNNGTNIANRKIKLPVAEATAVANAILAKLTM